jgi:hypothetical protein
MADEGSVCADWWACRAFDSQVDRRFSLTYVDLHDPYAPQSRGSNKLPPKYGSNTQIPKGALCPEKSIRSIKSSTVRSQQC